ncbi:6,7,8-trihydroxycoumarin synthase-like [Andrographis paniculata]|uniref:6,7,8-trihydroxycoumarin synthase-like n=1 Tax=Andrographis paniculata TaxID=175694 RepID=UPI0021E7E852|nr:6,7,8-trihydroxycoumarin synthase-like [Andrographis paniculata]
MFFALIVIILLVSLTLIKLPLTTTKSAAPPGPPGLPFIGNLLQFDRSKPHIHLWKLSKKYGPIIFLNHCSTRWLVVSSAAAAKQILKTDDLSFCRRPPVVGQQKLSYGGKDIAFSPYNNHSKGLRKICLHQVFSSKAALSFRPIREDEVWRMIDAINTSLRASSSSGSSSPINLSRLGMSLAVNLICRTAFGRRFEEDEYERIKFDRLIMEAQALMVSFYFGDHFPTALGWVDKVRGLSDRLRRNFEELDAFYEQIIEEHRGCNGEEEEDIVSFMIGVMEEEQRRSSMDFTREHLKGLLMNLFVAGTDTVAAAVVWAMTALSSRPAIMHKAQAQIRGLIGAKGTSRVEEEDLPKLGYLKAAVLETLRLFPPAPLLFRTQISNHSCTVGGFHVPPGTSVIVNGWALGRDPDNWEHPEEFRPERFLQDDGTINRDAAAFAVGANHFGDFGMVPFGGGRRGCPGKEIGLISTELALANLLYSFDWSAGHGCCCSTHEKDDIQSLPGLTTHKKNPLILMAKTFIQND